MNLLHISIVPGLDEAAAEACGFVPNPAEDIPTPLIQIKAATAFSVDYGPGWPRIPISFELVHLAQDEALSEAQLIHRLDRMVYLLGLAPGSAAYAKSDALQALFYRALRHGVALEALQGIATPEGRVFGDIITPRLRYPALPPSIAEQCAGLGIPCAQAYAALAEPDLRLESEIEVCAGWLLSETYVNAGAPTTMNAAWELLAQWIGENPGRRHLQPFADAWRSRESKAPTHRHASTPDGL